MNSSPSSTSALASGDASSQFKRLNLRGRVFLIGASVLLGFALLCAVAIGPVSIPFSEVFAHLGALFGLEVEGNLANSAIVELRVRRALMGLGVGASLGLAGAVLQGLFRNPLADPGLIGVSSGARLGATAFIVLGGSAFTTSSLGNLLFLPAAAFTGALGTMFLVRALAQRSGQTQVTSLLLAGLAITVFEEAFVGLLTTISNDEALRSAQLWRLGRLGELEFPIVGAVLAVCGLCAAFLLPMARALDVMLLGETEANHLGINVEAMKKRLVIFAALIVATATAFVGIIGFVGLVVPHVVRMVLGPSHRTLLPGSMLVGAILILAADLVARTISPPTEMPIGVVTAFIGAPFFLYLVFRNRG